MFTRDLEAGLTRELDFDGGRSSHIGQRVTNEFVGLGNLAHVADRLGTAEGFDIGVGGLLQSTELEQLGDQKRPREDRG